MEQEKKLSEFLKENNAYDAFVKNIIEEYNKGCLSDDWWDVASRDLISHAFSWINSKEGEDYWVQLCRKVPLNVINDMKDVFTQPEEEEEEEEEEGARDITPTLSQFLKEIGCYNSFINNLLSDRRRNGTPKDWADAKGEELISEAFAWHSSREGGDFWEDLSDLIAPNTINDMVYLLEEDIKPSLHTIEINDYIYLKKKFRKRFGLKNKLYKVMEDFDKELEEVLVDLGSLYGVEYVLGKDIKGIVKGRVEEDVVQESIRESIQQPEQKTEQELVAEHLAEIHKIMFDGEENQLNPRAVTIERGFVRSDKYYTLQYSVRDIKKDDKEKGSE